jgi:predicted Zn-dependent protease
MRKSLARRTALAACLVLLLAQAPAQAQKISNPELFGKSLEVAQKALEMYGAGHDPEEIERVADIGYRLAAESPFDAFPLTFHIAEMAAPNAFALPGGQLFVTRGMLQLGLSDDMLAGLLGHEIAHVVHQHGTRMQRRATLMNVLSQALMIGLVMSADNNRDTRGPQAPYDPRVGYRNQGSQQIAGAMATGIVVSELLLRGYSRDFEREADDEGQRLAAAAGFDPNGLGDLMALMAERLPQSKQYGYWQTHPFFDERVRGAAARSALLTAQPASSPKDYRLRTQAVLLTYLDQQKPKDELAELLKSEALAAWPIGSQAESIRLERLHALRDAEFKNVPLSRDYGAVLTAYGESQRLIERLDPESSLLARLRKETDELKTQIAELYPQAQEVLAGGIFETSFLERFESNFPDAPEAAKVALSLGDAYSRLGNSADAVEQYLRCWETAPDSEEGKRAQRGLHNLAPVLDNLAALEQMARQERDAALSELAETRLAQVAGSFEELANGSAYLDRFPNGSRSAVVTDRLNALADDLYAAVVLYQGVGDNVKALDRINQILTYAPASPAAARLREQAVVEG